VYWRNTPGLGLPARSYQRFYTETEARAFISMAGLLGLDTARQVMATQNAAARRALLDTALAERGLTPSRQPAAPVSAAVQPAPGLTSAATPPAGVADNRLAGVSFRQLWTTFLKRHRHARKGLQPIGNPASPSTETRSSRYRLALSR
jgi:hypothetical protein